MIKYLKETLTFINVVFMIAFVVYILYNVGSESMVNSIFSSKKIVEHNIVFD